MKAVVYEGPGRAAVPSGASTGTREVLELYYRRGLEAEDIGKTLGMDRNAVYQRLHQGHSKLREAFRDEG